MSPANPHQHPAWFGAVMGTGVLGVALSSLAAAFDIEAGWLQGVAGVFVLLASLLAVVLAPRYVQRLLPGGRQRLQQELRDPAAGALLATAPGGLLVLAAAWPRVLGDWLGDPAFAVGAVLVAAGAVLAVLLGLAWAYAIADAHEPRLHHVNGGWFVPPAVNVLVPLAIAPYLARVGEGWRSELFGVGLLFWGAGTLLFLVVLPLLVARIALQPMAPPATAPSHFIPLAPAGIAGAAAISLVAAAEQVGLVEAAVVSGAAIVATALAGFGLWYSVLALMFLRRARKDGAAPFHPGWWGFVFPLGAMAVGLALLSQAWDSMSMAWLGLAYAAAGLLAWAVVAANSLRLFLQEPPSEHR